MLFFNIGFIYPEEQSDEGSLTRDPSLRSEQIRSKEAIKIQWWLLLAILAHFFK
jgi:hypothetical protein